MKSEIIYIPLISVTFRRNLSKNLRIIRSLLWLRHSHLSGRVPTWRRFAKLSIDQIWNSIGKGCPAPDRFRWTHWIRHIGKGFVFVSSVTSFLLWVGLVRLDSGTDVLIGWSLFPHGSICVVEKWRVLVTRRSTKLSWNDVIWTICTKTKQ